MDIRVLKYFVQVAKDQNFTRAAEHLYISQPALSKMIKKLESELGIPLFDIRTNGVYLTNYGEQLFQRVLPLLTEFDSLTNFVQDIQAKPSGKLRVGVTPMLATLYMVDIITQFCNLWPNIELQITEHGSIALRKMLSDGELDLALCITGSPMAGLEDTILFEDEMVAVISTKNPLSNYEILHFSQLSDQPFNIYNQYSTLYQQIMDHCVKAGFIPQINLVSTKINFILQMTEHNLGICLLPRPYAMRGLRDTLKIIPFAEPFPWQGCIVRNSSIYQTNVSRIFNQFVLDHFNCGPKVDEILRQDKDN